MPVVAIPGRQAPLVGRRRKNLPNPRGFRARNLVLSLALQHGTPIEAIRYAVTRSGSGAAASILGAIVDVLPAIARGAA